MYDKNYYLYRVYKFNLKTKSAYLKIKRGAIDRSKLSPEKYTGRILQ